MTRGEIIKALMHCAGDRDGYTECTEDCPYYDVDEILGVCSHQLLADAAEMLQEDALTEDDGK